MNETVMDNRKLQYRQLEKRQSLLERKLHTVKTEYSEAE
jgi:hypothetical protein